MCFACCVFLHIILTKVFAVRDKRLIKYTALIALFFSIIHVIGLNLDIYDGLQESLKLDKAVKNTLKMAGVFGMFYSVVLLLLNWLKDIKLQNTQTGSVSSKHFLIYFAVIFLCWSLFFIAFLPGVVTSDSINQITQATGKSAFNNHHPVFHTFIIAVCMKIGTLFHSNMAGVLAYSVMQMIFLAAVFSFTLCYMQKRNVSCKVIYPGLLFFSLYPVNCMYSFSMWKDIPFSAFVLILTLLLVEFVTRTPLFLKSKIKTVSFVLAFIFVILLRNNGIYVVLITLVLLFFFMKPQRKYIGFISLTCMSFFIIYKSIIFPYFNIGEGSIREALSIPLQQTARVVKYHAGELTPYDKDIIHKILPVDNLGDCYDSRLSDPVKNHFSESGFKEYKADYFSIWIKMFFKYPEAYLSSFLCNSYGYLYPVNKGVITAGVRPNSLGITSMSPFLKGDKIYIFSAIIAKIQKIPVLSLFFSIGFVFDIILLLILLCCIKRKYKSVLVFIPALILLLTVLASPVCGEARYVYALFICLPLFVALTIESDKFMMKQEQASAISQQCTVTAAETVKNNE
jgi:hypothetical protein